MVDQGRSREVAEAFALLVFMPGGEVQVIFPGVVVAVQHVTLGFHGRLVLHVRVNTGLAAECPRLQRLMRHGHGMPFPLQRGVGEGGHSLPELPESRRSLPTAILPHPMLRGVLVGSGCTAEILLGTAFDAIGLATLRQHDVHVRVLLPAAIKRIVDGPDMGIPCKEGLTHVLGQCQPCRGG
jgi:hypothetical protein